MPLQINRWKIDYLSAQKAPVGFGHEVLHQFCVPEPFRGYQWRWALKQERAFALPGSEDGRSGVDTATSPLRQRAEMEESSAVSLLFRKVISRLFPLL